MSVTEWLMSSMMNWRWEVQVHEQLWKEGIGQGVLKCLAA